MQIKKIQSFAFTTEFKKNKFSEMFEISEKNFQTKYNKVCLKITKTINEQSDISELQQLVIDNEYFCLYHGEITQVTEHEQTFTVYFKLEDTDLKRFELECFEIEKLKCSIELYYF